MLNIKSQQLFFSLLFFLICYCILVSISIFRPPLALDSYWQLQMGKDFLDHGLSPGFDHYSFTFFGEKISSVPILFQIILAKFTSIFGTINGFHLIKIAYITLLFLCLYLYFQKIRASWLVVFFILPFISYYLILRLIVRPELISNIFIVICLILYLKARASFATKELLSICLLLLVWVNYHTPVFGYVIIFGLFVDKAVNKLLDSDNDFTWTMWFWWGILIFCIGFINPSFKHFFISMFYFSPEWAKYTQEYLPSYKIYSIDIMVYLLWILSVYITIYSIIKKQYGFAFISFFLVCFSWSIARLITSVALINFCIMAYYLSTLNYNKIKSKLNPAIKKILFAAFLGLPAVAYYHSINVAVDGYKDLVNKNEIMENRYPVQIVDYLKNFQNGGNILNPFNAGGYIIHYLSPDYKVYIDGRTNILYPLEFFKHYLEFTSNEDKLNEEIKKQSFDYIISRNNEKHLLRLNSLEGFSVNFANKYYLLFSKNKEIAFPIASNLINYPMCWDDKLVHELKGEIVLSEKIFSKKSYDLQSILKILKEYISYSNKEIFFDDLNINKYQNDNDKRLIAYLAIKSDDYHRAVMFFDSIKNKVNNDLLLQAYSTVKTRKYRDGESILINLLYKIKKSRSRHLSTFEKRMLLKTLSIIHSMDSLEKFSIKDIDALKSKVEFSKEDDISLISVTPHENVCESIFK